MRRWVGDLALGLRLAVGGRSSFTRFLLSTIGIAMGVTVLLLGASVGNLAHQHDLRSAATSFSATPIDGVDPLYQAMMPTEFRGEKVERYYVHAEGENHPLPPGIDRMPAEGEVLVSPALAELLDSPDGELLRPRVSGEIVGILDQPVVVEPDDLLAYIGVDPGFAESVNAHPVYEFDGEVQSSQITPDLMAVMLVGIIVLLVPVFIFVSSASRVAGVERDRRLSALRLVGADARQVRRIAAAEAVVSAMAGLVAGAGLFLVARAFVEEVELFDRRVYTEDVVPDPVLTALIVLVVPALAVLAAQFAMRGTVIEPLGVVRHATPVRRRAGWRFGLVAAGVALLVGEGVMTYGTDLWAYTLAAGAALLLIGVPVLLPLLVERSVRRIRGGPSSWQLAIRRLQLDSGTSARVVGGIAVVLAGAIALQTIVLTVEADLALPSRSQLNSDPQIEVLVEDPRIAEDVAADLAAVPAMRDAFVVRQLPAYDPNSGPRGEELLSVLDCAGVQALSEVDCVDGDVFALGAFYHGLPKEGSRLEFRDYRDSDREENADYEVTGTWTVPRVKNAPYADALSRIGGMIVTPGALAGVRLADLDAVAVALAGPLGPDDGELIRNATAKYTWRVYMFSFTSTPGLNLRQETFVAIRDGLYVGSVFTLLLAGLSLLVLALEQLRERRRPLAVLVATGVPTGVLARSLLWQVVLPIVLGVVVAVATGIVTAWLVLRATRGGLDVDWLGVGLLSAGAAALALVVTAMTLPFLRGATRLTSLRTE
jgi:hypothetical protein